MEERQTNRGFGPRVPGRPCWRWLLIALCVLSGLWASEVRCQNPPDYQVKAVFLFNFAQFAEWPPSSFAGLESPIVIGVFGANPFKGSLGEVVQGEVVNDRKLAVKNLQRIDEVTACHILFIAESEKAKLPQILKILSGKSVLTVSDMDGFAERGGMIAFNQKDRRIGLRINIDATKAAHIKLSSKLLNLAEVIPTEKMR